MQKSWHHPQRRASLPAVYTHQQSSIELISTDYARAGQQDNTFDQHRMPLQEQQPAQPKASCDDSNATNNGKPQSPPRLPIAYLASDQNNQAVPSNSETQLHVESGSSDSADSDLLQSLRTNDQSDSAGITGQSQASRPLDNDLSVLPEDITSDVPNIDSNVNPQQAQTVSLPSPLRMFRGFLLACMASPRIAFILALQAFAFTVSSFYMGFASNRTSEQSNTRQLWKDCRDRQVRLFRGISSNIRQRSSNASSGYA